jgi:hypothetical protein
MHLLITLLIASAAPASVPPRLPPVDECTAQPGFAEFRTALRDAIARKDVKALLALTDKDIDISFGAEKGQAEFVQSWRLDKPAESSIWGFLSDALDLGCASDGTVAVSPSMVSKLPGDYDAFETYVPVQAQVPLYAKPGDPEPVAMLEWDILRVGDWVEWDGTGEYTPVTLADGRRGWVPEEMVRSPIDEYRAYFEKVDGVWKMTVFIAGD